MITLTRRDGSRFAVNPDLIERAQESPDTTIRMVDGGLHVIVESIEQLTDLIVAYRARVLAAAADLSAEREV